MLKKQIIPIVRAFQSALPRGERQQIGGSPDEDRNISIHAPTRGATRNRPPMGRIHRKEGCKSREVGGEPMMNQYEIMAEILRGGTLR